MLGLHRLGWKKGEEFVRVNSGKGSVQKKVVYLHHGLMMNSEVWVCLTEQERCLPFLLVERGYDVWVCQHLNGGTVDECQLTFPSWATTEETNTPKNRPHWFQPIPSSGPSPLINLPSTISQTRLTTFSKPRASLRYLISGSPKVLPKLSLLFLSTQHSMTRSMCSSRLHLPCLHLV